MYGNVNGQGAGLGSCGLGCDCGGKCGMGDLTDPSTWGPSDWVVAVGAVFAAWRIFRDQRRASYVRKVRKRLGAA